MTEYVLATEADDVERRRMALLFAYHGALTIEALEAAGVSCGWRPEEEIDAALAALGDPQRQLTGPTRWVIRARVAPRDRPTAVARSRAQS